MYQVRTGLHNCHTHHITVSGKNTTTKTAACNVQYSVLAEVLQERHSRNYQGHCFEDYLCTENFILSRLWQIVSVLNIAF